MRLKVSSHLGLLFDLEVVDGRVTYHFVEQVLQESVLRWVDQGIIMRESANGELAYDKYDSWDYIPVPIKVDSPLFVYALESYLGKQFNQFTYEVTDD